MGTIHCIKHPKYQGKESPVLSCKTCCGLFVAAIKAKQPEKSLHDWLKEKTEESRKARGYNPSK